jgi:hypothetical protein
MIRKILGAILFVSIHCLSFGQEEKQLVFQQPFRFEKDIKFSEDNFMVIAVWEEGLVLMRDKQKFKSGNKTWELIILDNSLRVTHELDLEVEQRRNMIGYEYSPGWLFLLFRVPEIQKSTMEIYAINLVTAEIKKHEARPELAFQLTHFSKVGGSFLLGGYVTNEPAILLYNPATDNLKVLPGFFQKQTELIDLRPNQNQTFNAILVDRSDRDQRKLIFKTFDVNGFELLEDGCLIEEKYVLQTGLSTTLVKDDLLVVGTWGIRNSKQSVGFYTIPIDPFTDHKANYTAFGELDHFLDFMNPKKAKRIKEKTQDAVKAQKVPDFTSHVMPYRIDEHEEGYILLAEVFTPSSSYNYNRYPMDYPYGYPSYPMYSPFWGYYPSMYNRMYSPFYMSNNNNRSTDEVKTTQSVLVAFNSQGSVLWDFSINLGEIRTSSLEQIADFYIDNGIIRLVYKKESELVIKSIILKTGEVSETNEKIMLLNDTDELRSDNKNFGAVRHWYGNNFYVWGQQNLRNRANRDEGTRQVFFVSKLVVE